MIGLHPWKKLLILKAEFTFHIVGEQEGQSPESCKMRPVAGTTTTLRLAPDDRVNNGGRGEKHV
jgi:hypothetical protein